MSHLNDLILEIIQLKLEAASIRIHYSDIFLSEHSKTRAKISWSIGINHVPNHCVSTRIINEKTGEQTTEIKTLLLHQILTTLFPEISITVVTPPQLEADESLSKDISLKCTLKLDSEKLNAFCMQIYQLLPLVITNDANKTTKNIRNTLSQLSDKEKTKANIISLIRNGRLNQGRVRYAPIVTNNTLVFHIMYTEADNTWFIPSSEKNVYLCEGSDLLKLAAHYPFILIKLEKHFKTKTIENFIALWTEIPQAERSTIFAKMKTLDDTTQQALFSEQSFAFLVKAYYLANPQALHSLDDAPVFLDLLESDEAFRKTAYTLYLKNDPVPEWIAEHMLTNLHLYPKEIISEHFARIYSTIKNPDQLRFNSKAQALFVQACIDANIENNHIIKDYQDDVVLERSFRAHMPQNILVFLKDLQKHIETKEGVLLDALRVKYFDTIFSSTLTDPLKTPVLNILVSISQLPSTKTVNGIKVDRVDMCVITETLRRGFFKFCKLNQIDINGACKDIMAGALFMQRNEKKNPYFSFKECLEILMQVQDKHLMTYAHTAALSLVVCLDDAKQLVAVLSTKTDYIFNPNIWTKEANLYFASVLANKINKLNVLCDFKESFKMLASADQEALIAMAHAAQDKFFPLIELLVAYYAEKQNAKKIVELIIERKNNFPYIAYYFENTIAVDVYKALYEQNELVLCQEYFDSVLSADERKSAALYLLTEKSVVSDHLTGQRMFNTLAANQQKQLLTVFDSGTLDYAQLKNIAQACFDALSKSEVSGALAAELVHFFARIERRENKTLNTLDKIELYYILNPYMNNAAYSGKDLHKKIKASNIHNTLKKQIYTLLDQYASYCNNDADYACAIAAIAIRQTAAKYLFEHNATRLYWPTEDNSQAKQMINETNFLMVCNLYKNYINQPTANPSSLKTELQQLQNNAAVKKIMAKTTQ